MLQEDIKKIILKQEAFFKTGKTKDISFRLESLKKLKKAIKENENEISDALKKDFNKPAFESYETEIGMLYDEINFFTKHIPSWSKPKKVRTTITNFLAFSYIYPEPYGISLIIAPWNYPFQLTISPLIGSISAGNCSVLKPSEFTPNTSKIISKIIKDNFEEGFITTIEGDAEVNKLLLDEKFDYIFFTGSVNVGKIVMEKASKNLTPITLELGGKSPCIIDKDTNLALTAKRIAWGKFLNAGQTCVAPDYLLIDKNIKQEFINAMGKYIKEFYGNEPQKSPDFPRIVNEIHFERLSKYLEKGNILIGGQTDKKDCYIAPTLIDNVNWDDPIMQDEIFGPILPMIEYDNLNYAIESINSRPKPLALYIFSNNKNFQDKILLECSSGGCCINDTILHLASPYLPFGGVGNSGIGSYHGKATFDTFTHYKSVLKRSFLVDLALKYPPYNEKNLKQLKMFLK